MRFTLITFTLIAGALAQSADHSTATSTTSSSATVSSTSTSASESASESASKTASSSASATPSGAPIRSTPTPKNSIPKAASCALSCLANVRDRFNDGQGCDPTVGRKCMCEDEEVNKQLGRCIQMMECGNETLEYIRDVTYEEERCKPEGLKYNKDAFNAGAQAAGGDLGKTEEQKEEEEGAAGKSAVGLGVMAGAAVLALAVVL